MTYSEYQAAYEAGIEKIKAEGRMAEKGVIRELVLSIVVPLGIVVSRGAYPEDLVFLDLVKNEETTKEEVVQYIESKHGSLADCVYLLTTIIDCFNDRQLSQGNPKVAMMALKPVVQIIKIIS